MFSYVLPVPFYMGLFVYIKSVNFREESDDSESESVDNVAKTVARNTYLASVLSALPHTLLAFDHG